MVGFYSLARFLFVSIHSAGVSQEVLILPVSKLEKHI